MPTETQSAATADTADSTTADDIATGDITAGDISGAETEAADAARDGAAAAGHGSLEDLGDEICRVAAQIATVTARWLLLIADFDAREGWAGLGMRSCAHWLNLHCGLSLGAAREHVRTARAMTGLPVIKEAFTEGQLSYSKVRALTRVATPADEVELTELARAGSASQVERTVRAYRQVRQLDPTDPGPELFVRWHWDEQGCLSARLRLGPEDGARFIALLEHAQDQLSRDQHPDEDAGRDQESAAQGNKDTPGHQDSSPGRRDASPTHEESSPGRRDASPTHEEASPGRHAAPPAHQEHSPGHGSPADPARRAPIPTQGGTETPAGDPDVPDPDIPAGTPAEPVAEVRTAHQLAGEADGDVPAGTPPADESHNGLVDEDSDQGEAADEPVVSTPVLRNLTPGSTADKSRSAEERDGIAALIGARGSPGNEPLGVPAGRPPPFYEQDDGAPGSRVSWVAALGFVLRQGLAGTPAPTSVGDRCQVVVHVDTATLAADQGQLGQLEDGPALPSETLRRLACDAAVVAMLRGPAGEVLDVGRRTRLIPPALARALRVRDQGNCRFPGCTRRRWLHTHHIMPWSHGGPTSLPNLMLICPFHHRAVHEGGYRIEITGTQQFRFLRPNGEPVPNQPFPMTPATDPLPDLGPDALFPPWAGGRLDLQHAITGLLSLHRDTGSSTAPHSPPDPVAAAA